MALPEPYYQTAGSPWIRLYHADARDLLTQMLKDNLSRTVAAIVTDPPGLVGRTDEPLGAVSNVSCGIDLCAQVAAESCRRLAVFTPSSGRAQLEVAGAIHKTLRLDRSLAWARRTTNSRAVGPWKWDLTLVQLYGEWGHDEKASDVSSCMVTDGTISLARTIGHPAPVPYAVMHWILAPIAKQVAEHGGAILDPFCGSGTTLLVARELGMKAIGIESNEEFCNVAKGRLTQGSLFGQDSEPQL